MSKYSTRSSGKIVWSTDTDKQLKLKKSGKLHKEVDPLALSDSDFRCLKKSQKAWWRR